MLQDFLKSKFGLSYSDDIVFSQEDAKAGNIIVSLFLTFFVSFSRQFMIICRFLEMIRCWHDETLFPSFSRHF